MIPKEVFDAWDEVGFSGRLAFLFRSKFMLERYPDDNDEFIRAVDRFSKSYLEKLPGELQAEFAGYAETPRFQQIWLRKGGDTNEGKVQEGKRDEEHH